MELKRNLIEILLSEKNNRLTPILMRINYNKKIKDLRLSLQNLNTLKNILEGNPLNLFNKGHQKRLSDDLNYLKQKEFKVFLKLNNIFANLNFSLIRINEHFSLIFLTEEVLRGDVILNDFSREIVSEYNEIFQKKKEEIEQLLNEALSQEVA